MELSLGRYGFFHAVELSVNSARGNPEELGGDRLVPLGVTKRLSNHPQLDLSERRSYRKRHDRRDGTLGVGNRIGQIAFRQGVASAEHDTALDHVLELAHVAWPAIVEQTLECSAGWLQARPTVLGAIESEEMVDE